MKYYANYKGWNSHFDGVHIASKTKELEPEIDNDTHSLKISFPEVCIIIVNVFIRKWL